MYHSCVSCNHCISIRETFPYGVCIFFPSGHRNVHVLDDGCPNHSLEVEEERQLEEKYYESLRKRQ